VRRPKVEPAAPGIYSKRSLKLLADEVAGRFCDKFGPTRNRANRSESSRR
jgi:hypothetical protein